MMCGLMGGALGFNNGASNVIGISAATVTYLKLIGNVNHYVFIMNSTGNLSGNSIYINGVKQSISAVVGSDGAVGSLNATVYLATWSSAVGFFGNIAYSNFRTYNRALSNVEIVQNYNSAKGRFGI